MIENIEYFFSSPIENPEFLRNLYTVNGLSASEIARKYRHSKAYVLDLLKRHSIECRAPHTNGDKSFTPSFGYRDAKRSRRIEPAEQKVIKKILKMRSENLSLRAIARALGREGIAARNHSQWHPQKIKRILMREGRAVNNKSHLPFLPSGAMNH